MIDILLQGIENETRMKLLNVKYDKPTGFFKINAEKIIIANSTDENQNWKFLTVDNPRMKTILEKIIPAELLN